MAQTLTFNLFAPVVSSEASRPGASSRRVRLQTEKLDVLPDQSSPFATMAGSAAVVLENLTEQAHGFFEGGKKYKVTIEPIS